MCFFVAIILLSFFQGALSEGVLQLPVVARTQAGGVAGIALAAVATAQSLAAA